VRLGFKVSAGDIKTAEEIAKKMFSARFIPIEIEGVKEAGIEDFKSVNVSLS